jgi:hypothetical protein
MTQWLGSVMSGSVSAPPVRFAVGDTVEVLNSVRLPKVEQVIHVGAVKRITCEDREWGPLYWIEGRHVACGARQLRLVRRAR